MEKLEIVDELLTAFYSYVPKEVKERLKKNVNEIRLGEMPPYLNDDVGAYSNGKVYLSPEVLYYQDPKEIAEIFFMS